MLAISSTFDSAPALPAATATDLVEFLRLQFGSRFTDTFGKASPAAVRDEWARSLAGFRPEELERGVAECRTRAWPPSSVGEFAHWCRPAMDPETAWIEAEHGLRARSAGQVGAWSHPAVFRAACRMSTEIRSGAYAHNRKRWEFLLRRELADGWGDEVPPVPKRVEYRPTAVPAPERVRALLASLKRGRA